MTRTTDHGQQRNRRAGRLAAVICQACAGALTLTLAGTGAVAAAHAGDLHAPLAPAGSMDARGQHAAVERLRIDPDVLASLGTGTARMALPLGGGAAAVVHLTRVDPIAPGAQIVRMTEAGPQPLVPTITLWRGVVENQPGSEVFLGLSREQAHGWVRLNTPADRSLHLITTATIDGVPTTMAYDAALLQAGVGGEQRGEEAGVAPLPVCGGAIAVPGDKPPPPTGPFVLAPRAASCVRFQIALDTDNEFRNRFTSADAAADYAAFLLAAVSEIYNRDVGVGFQISFLRVWDVADPWTAADNGAQLPQFRDYWRANHITTPRAIAHLLSARSLGGGIAYLRTTCSNDWGFAVNANLNGSFPYPISNNQSTNWDLMVFAHELGHNVGSEHTHNLCAYNPIIDGCGSGFAGPGGCEGGTRDCAAGAARIGTIMSYCHTCSGGMANQQMTLGPRVSARIAAYLQGQTCGSSSTAPEIASVVVSQNPACIGQTAVLTANLTPASGPSVTYQWAKDGTPIPGATLPELVLLNVQSSAAGTYSVVVRNACGVVPSTPAQNVVLTTTTNCPSQTCYANCDASVSAPTLNALDFVCFLDRFRQDLQLAPAQQAQAYSNCDNSTLAPVLNALDFNCFLSRFRAGCQ